MRCQRRMIFSFSKSFARVIYGRSFHSNSFLVNERSARCEITPNLRQKCINLDFVFAHFIAFKLFRCDWTVATLHSEFSPEHFSSFWFDCIMHIIKRFLLESPILLHRKLIQNSPFHSNYKNVEAYLHGNANPKQRQCEGECSKNQFGHNVQDKRKTEQCENRSGPSIFLIDSHVNDRK